ncbi:MAG: ABC transporter permease [Bacteroidota bacterium]
MRRDNTTPPRLADRLLEWYCNPVLLEDLQGDLYERHIRRLKKYGRFRTRLAYFWDVLSFIRPYTIRRDSHRSIRPFGMLPNYLKTSYRSLVKQRLNSLINILGLSLGLSAFVLICLYVNDELKYDRYLPNAERIYRITLSYTSESSSEHAAWSDPAVGPALKLSYPEVEAYTALINEKILVSHGERTFNEEQFFFAYPDFFKVFSYDFEKKGSHTDLEEGTVVLTSKMARKYFEEADPIGQTLLINNQAYQVSGVLKDLPSHTDLKFDALIGTDDLSKISGWTFNYVLFKNESDAATFQPKLDKTFEDTFQDEFEAYGVEARLHMEALPDVHFGSKKLYDTPKSDKNNLYIFSTVAFLILIIAGINYVNISLANTARRQTEVGVRKSIGAYQSQLRAQFLFESLIVCFISLTLALLTIWFFLPYLNVLTEKQISWREIMSPNMSVFLLVTTIVLGMVTGSYPAFYLSSARPVEVLKGRIVLKGKSLLRRGLVALQFTVSIALIIATLFVYRQLQLIKTKSHGYDKDQVMVIDIPGLESDQSMLRGFKNKLLEYPFVSSASIVGFNAWPTADMPVDVYEVEINDSWQLKPFNNIEVDQHYFDVLGLNLTEGRSFNANDMNGRLDVVVVNQAMIKQAGWSDPLQQQVTFEDGATATVIGVVDDFHFNSFHEAVEPILIFPDDGYAEKILLKISAKDWYQSVATIETVWREVMEGQPLEFRLLDEYFQQQYKSEQTLRAIFTYFMAVAMIIACLGLFGLISLYTQQKLKEVSLRKIFGARVFQLFFTLSREFLILLLIAFVVATPLALFSMKAWLESFVYKTALSLDVFLIAGSLILLVSLMTMSFHIFKTLRTNPAKTLKYD